VTRPGRAIACRRPVALALVWGALLASGCAGEEATAPARVAAGPPHPFAITVRDLLTGGELALEEAELVVDGSPLSAPAGRLVLELAPGRHTLTVRRAGYRPDLFVLRFAGESGARAQAVGSGGLSFDLGREEAADLLLVRRDLDVPYLRSLLDGAVDYRWGPRVNLHVDVSSTRSGFALSPEQTDSVVSFVSRALPELTAGGVSLGSVTTGVGLDWESFLHGERRGAITLQIADFAASPAGVRALGWTLYRRDPESPGRIRSANVILDVGVFRPPHDFRPVLGHELGHALSLQHPIPCRHWSRMDPELASCRPPLAIEATPETFWPPVDRETGRILYAFVPGTDFARVPAVSPP
jgi:hypothetical protein